MEYLPKMTWISEFGGVQDKFFSRNNFIEQNNRYDDKVEEFISLCRNIDVYKCAYSYENKDINSCKIIGDPYLDFDCDHLDTEWDQLIDEVKYVVNYIETSMRVPPEELRMYFSGSKGFHVIIPKESLGLEPSTDLNSLFRYFAMGMSFLCGGKNVLAANNGMLDLQIYDRRRLFRLPNSINSKSGRYKVPVSIDHLYDLNREEMLEWSSEVREVSTRTPRFRPVSKEGFEEIVEIGKDYEVAKIGKKRRRSGFGVPLQEGELLDLLPCAKSLLDAGIQEGNRNNGCYALTSSLLQSGYKFQEAYSMVEEWNDRNEKPLNDKELFVTASSALSSFEKGMRVGCGTYSDLGLCTDKCKLLN